jgi:perosamine synthetase
MINASLGSHYSNGFIKQSLIQLGLTLLNIKKPDYKKELKKELGKFWPGEINLVYKGRDAIDLCLRRYGIDKNSDGVMTQAFTCGAIEEGIGRAGATPLYVDIDKKKLNPTVDILEKAWNNNKQLKIKAIIIQHSLGNPADIKDIYNWTQKKKILLIEDLAQSFGAKDNDEKLLGSYADAIILSFGRDKIIDAVSGGAIVYKTKPTNNLLEEINSPKKHIVIKDLSYPFFTWLIRSTFNIGVGKIIHKFLKKINWFYSPVNSPTNKITSLPSAMAALALIQIRDFSKNHQHRKKMFKLYSEKLSSLPIKIITNSGSFLRFVFLTSDHQGLIESWRKNNIHLSDRWYRQAVDCGSRGCSKFYSAGSCINAEEVSNQIVNLPTHQKISLKDAEKIVRVTLDFYKK